MQRYPTQRCSDAKRRELFELAEKHLAAVVSSGKHKLNPSVEEYWRLIISDNLIRLIKKTCSRFQWD